MSRLTDRINSAPEGSRLRSILLDDSSSSEDEDEEEWSEDNDGVENAWKSVERKKNSLEQQEKAKQTSPRINSVHVIDDLYQSGTVDKLTNDSALDGPELKYSEGQSMQLADKKGFARVSLSPVNEKARARRTVSSLESLAPPPPVADLKPLKKRKVADVNSDHGGATIAKKVKNYSDKKNDESLLEPTKSSATRAKEMASTPKARKKKIVKYEKPETEKNNQILESQSTLNTKGTVLKASAETSCAEKPNPTSNHPNPTSNQKPKFSRVEGKISNPNNKTSNTVEPSKESTNASSDNPKTKKKKKRTFQDQVLAQMLFSCKAYSLKTLANAINSTENMLNHLMLSLLDKKLVLKKEFTSKSGKTREIYWANQDSKAKEILKLIPDANEVLASKQELISLQKNLKDIEKDMAFLTQELSNEEIDHQLLDLETAVTKQKTEEANMRERIQQFKSNPTVQQSQRVGIRAIRPSKTPAQLAKERCPRRLKMRINALRSQWKSRKEKCVDFIDQLSDAMEKKPKDIIKLLDLETDEMEGVKMPPKHVIESGK